MNEDKNEEKKQQGTLPEDDTAALFVTARKKQLAEQEAQRKAAEEEAKRAAAEAEVRRLEAEIAARKQKAEAEARQLEQGQPIPAVQPQPVGTMPGNPGKKSWSTKKKVLVTAGIVAGVAAVVVLIMLIIGTVIGVLMWGEIEDEVFADNAYDYAGWEKALTISVDEYHELNEEGRKGVIEDLNELFAYNGEQDKQADFQTSEERVADYDDVSVSSLFRSVCWDVVDTELYLYGDSYAFPDPNVALQMNVHEFLALNFPQKVQAVYYVLEYNGLEYNNPALLHATFSAISRLSKLTESESSGTAGMLFMAVGMDYGIDASAYMEYAEKQNASGHVQGGHVVTSLGNLPERTFVAADLEDGGIILTDTLSGLNLEVPAGAVVGGSTSWADEICTISSGRGCIMVFDVTEATAYYETDNDLLYSYMDAINRENFMNITGEEFYGLDFENVQVFEEHERVFRRKVPIMSESNDYILFGSMVLTMAGDEARVHLYLVMRRGDSDEDRAYYDDIISSAVVN